MLPVLLTATIVAPAADPVTTPPLPGFRTSAWFEERVREEWVTEGVRAIANAPANFDPKKPTQLVIYATPNGNSVEQTFGCATGPGLDWHFDIQHVAAQVRKLREVRPGENIVLVCVEADGLSWPAWKRRYKDGPDRVRKVVDVLRQWVPGVSARVSLAGHSGGGSFLFGLLDNADRIPDWVERMVFLDANYSYSDADKHGEKLLSWLNGDTSRRLVVIAYDDRNIELDGKKVIGPDGGTFRATERMRTRFAKDVTFAETKAGDVTTCTALGGQLALLVHANPKNKILHTALVGEMNGLLRGLTDPGVKPEWGTFGAPRTFTAWVQPGPGIPKRPADATGGTAFFKSLDKLPLLEREEVIAREILRGNVPEFLRTFQKITTKARDASGKEHTVVFEVMPDYLAVGSDADFVRVPMTPQTAARIADAFGCAVPTRKVADEVYRAAVVKLEPKPLTEDRERPSTFLKHNVLIEEQRRGRKLGELAAGIKKDVVVSNRLTEKPGRVAIYGWHKLDGKAIQLLTIVHGETYVDYSHGVRLMKRTVLVDNQPRDVRHVLYSSALHALLSDEGPVTRPAY
ncbi:hypothetical protein GobsT_55740 [Gemmata obscuriglobus]|nr:hypothetical protein [Gemmata obscuriglobus]QEG30762.1 hypothetical protein GobsT_55740 [Gemmata obscuriglobus]VTS10092.1 Uncharacterized protein OS=Bacteroides oleiciplenus YIT 12058 GN=HMPREF9447_01984 PE=4 SV=1 [Gemmata obscuriglobus UQM 2246]